MSQPNSCIRCKGTELVEATFAGTGALRLIVDEAHSSSVGARVCLACGAVLLTAAEPAGLRVDPAPGGHVQEFDF